MKKRFFLCLFAFIFFIGFIKFDVDAKRIDEFEIYIETGPVEEKKKVYLTDELAFFLQGSSLEIEDEPESTGWWIFEKTVHHYYYMASRHIDEIVYSRRLDNTIDSVVYMVKQLEFYAAEYKLGHSTSKTTKDLVLGYLRCINKNYTEASQLYDDLTKMGYSVLCGSFDEEFVNHVNQLEAEKKKVFNVNITLYEFFGRYLKESEYNENYGEFLYEENKLIEPVENLKVDVPHMFCVMDALRHMNASMPIVGFQLVSWLGDLHQATYTINLNYYGQEIDFKRIILDDASRFSVADFIADVDGYNIGFAILSNGKNEDLKVSDAINSYYEMIKLDKTNRYKIFIKSVSYEAENACGDSNISAIIKRNANDTINTGINGFRYSVCSNMIVSYLDYSYSEIEIYPYSINPLYKFMCNGPEGKKDFPSGELRSEMAKSFVNYVLEKAGYDYEKENC